MKNLSLISILSLSLIVSLNTKVFADDPKGDAVAKAIDRNTKAVEDNTKAVKDAAAGGSAVKTVADAGFKAGVAWTIFKIGDAALKILTKVKAGPGMFIIIPDSVLKNMRYGGSGSVPEAMNISDEPASKTLDGAGSGSKAPSSGVLKSVAS
ncbi:MAG: hypothetical protein HY074_07170 [Deltaproteobacteria bacterium]|nr:hypothetical protein [Deltaproteobacteria bacterium]